MNFWFFLQSGPGAAASNMAMDEALLEEMPRLLKPILRFYSWSEPAASFGYFQKFSEVERVTQLRPLVRRPTGGGLVPHDADWTYSLVFPPNHEWHSTTAIESYRLVHAWIQAAFTQLQIPTELAPCCGKSEPGQCFSGHEKFDLLWKGKKMAGAAQRRNKLGLLIQGSVQPPPISLQRYLWETAMRDVGKRILKAESAEFQPGAELLDRANELARNKYSQAAYNEQR
jgi:lipoate-protein ligase A